MKRRTKTLFSLRADSGCKNRVIVHISALPFYTVDEEKRSGMPSIANSVNFYAKRGWKTVFLYPSAKKIEPIKYGQDICLFPIYFPFLPSGNNDIVRNMKTIFFSFVYMILFPAFIYKIVFKTAPHLIYSHGAAAVFPSKILAKILNVPVVSRLYGIGSSDVLKKSKISSWKELKELYWALPEWIALKLKADAYVITDDGSDGENIAKKFGIYDRSFIARNGVDPVLPSREDIDLIRRTFLEDGFERLILYIGRIDRGKRCDRILAVAELAFKLKLPWRFIIIGEGPEHRNLVRISERKGLSNRLLLIGAVPHEEIWKYLYAADVFLALPDHACISNTLLEALSAGTPVVIRDKGVGLKELLGNASTNYCLISDPDNIIGIVGCLKRVIERGKNQMCVKFDTWEQRMLREEEYLSDRGLI